MRYYGEKGNNNMRLALYVLKLRQTHPLRTSSALQTMSPDVFFNRSVNTCQENLPLRKQGRAHIHTHGGPTHTSSHTITHVHTATHIKCMKYDF